MDSFRENCEIIEAKDCLSTTQRKVQQISAQDRDIMKKEANKFLENDINKLFEAINIRTTSKSLDLTHSQRNSSKKATGSNSPGIGFSEPVSLKQALRGLCVTQASEMAATKRLSMASASPRISETFKLMNLPLHLQEPMTIIKPPNISVSIKETSDPIEKSKNFLKVTEKVTPKLRQQSRLQTVSSSSSVKSNKEMKSTRKTSRGVRVFIMNRNLVIKKSIKLAITTRGNSKTAKNVPGQGSEQLICQKCECSLRQTSNSESVPISGDNKRPPLVKILKMPSKSSSKGSSIGDYSSSSTTSFSEESNLSGSIGNRPHMSKDVKWGAINRIREECGFVGLSHFNLIKKLGAGDIGTVYLAALIGTRCLFAIKVMDNELLGKRKKMARAQTDREILGMLDHPFLPTLYAQFVTDNLSCLVMEFCPGGDLHVLRQKQPGRYFPEQAARFYAAEVLLALEYLHMLGIIYRDLKPENILVREDGHIMLTDFDLSLKCSVSPTILKSSPARIEPPRLSGQCTGSNCIDPFCSAPSCKFSCFSPSLLKARNLKKPDTASKARSLTQLVAEPNDVRSNSFVGTHEYLAPEIIKCEGHGSSVDWWTFGVFLYELLYGKTPFKGGGNDETLVNVVKKSLKFPNTSIVSFQARDLIRGLLVKEPENRLGTETGAAEIKRHPFFKGLNWALIRCAVPPQIPEVFDFGNKEIVFKEKGKKFMVCNVNGGHVEFELF